MGRQARNTTIAMVLSLMFPGLVHSQVWHSTMGPRFLTIDSTRALIKPSVDQDASTFAAFLTGTTDQITSVEEHYRLEGFLVCALSTPDRYTSFLDSLRTLDQVALVEPYYLTESGDPFLVGESFCAVFDPDLSMVDIEELNRQYGASIDYVFGGKGNVMTLKNSRGSGLTTLELANLYHDLRQTEIAHPNFEVKHSYLSPYLVYDYYHEYQWHLKNITGSFNEASVWDFAGLTDSVIVAVVDDGVEEHEDLPASRILQGYDFGDYDLDASPPPDSTHMHGQACAGIIAASHTYDSLLAMDHNTGVISLSSYIRILPLKLDRNDGTIQGLPLDRFGRAIDMAWDMGADVICCPWSFLPPHDENASITVPINHACSTAVLSGRNGLGTPVIFGAGNRGLNYLQYPARHPLVFSPGAVNSADSLWAYSNYSAVGKQLDLVTPSGGLGYLGDVWTVDLMGNLGWNNTVGVVGRMPAEPGHGWDTVDIWDCPPGQDDIDYFCSFGGTSASTAITAGVAALLIARNPEIRASDHPYFTNVYETLRGSAVPLSATVPDTLYGWGRIDAYRAILSIARGDVNNDSEVTLADATYLANWLFVGPPAPWPDERLGDVNCDGDYTLGDVMLIVDHAAISLAPLPLPCFEFDY